LQGQWTVSAVEKGKEADAALAETLGYGSPVDPARLYRLDFRLGNPWPHQPQTPLGFQFDPRVSSPDPPRGDHSSFLFYRIDPTATPKTMDIISVSGDNASQKESLQGVAIYELEGDHLKIAIRSYSPSITSDQRPKQFVSAPDSDVIILHLDRYRPD